jgi:hypothetical protein
MPLLLLLPALVAEGPGASLAIDQILARHLEALGGAAKLKAQRSRRTTATLQGLAPFDVPILVEQTRDRYRREVRIQDAVQITAHSGKAGWKVDPFVAGSAAPQDLKGDELEDLLEQMDFDGDLVDAAAKGHAVRVEGVDRLPSGPAYHLDLRLASGRRSTVWLDAGTFLEVKRVQTRPQGGQPLTVELRSEDYREVEGVKVPFRVTITPQGAERGLLFRTLAVEVNPPLAETRFARPGA